MLKIQSKLILYLLLFCKQDLKYLGDFYYLVFLKYSFKDAYCIKAPVPEYAIFITLFFMYLIEKNTRYHQAREPLF